MKVIIELGYVMVDNVTQDKARHLVMRLKVRQGNNVTQHHTTPHNITYRSSVASPCCDPASSGSFARPPLGRY
jgi:hypothetical protein